MAKMRDLLSIFSPIREREIWPYGLRTDFTHMTPRELKARIDERIYRLAFGKSIFYPCLIQDPQLRS